MRLIREIGIILITIFICRAEFDPSRFNFGCDWEYPSKDERINELKEVVDYMTIWCHEDTLINPWHGAMVDTCRKYNLTPVFYGYLVAGLSNLGDADVGGRLDAQGGAWLRNNINKVVQTYESYAQKIASRYGTSKPVIWLMEPDYSQYWDGDGNDLSRGEAADFMSRMIGAIKKHLPNAYFSLDISPWINDQTSYIQNFDMSQFSFMSNSGGRTQAGSARIRNDNNNNVTWAGVNSASGKCIIADAGYGVGGTPTGHASDWDDVNNIKNRMKDGVVAITHKSPRSGWGNTVKSLKASLSGISTKCSNLTFKMAYSLTVTEGSGGKVSISPEAAAYDSGKTVTITAIPNSGYKLAGWTGDTAATASELTLTMNRDFDIKANFIDENAQPTYSLSVKVSGSGVVIREPDKSMYELGTMVTLDAYIVNGSSLTGWSGDVTGTKNPVTVVMDGNKTVTATFTGDDIVSTNYVQNGQFSDGEADWTFGAFEGAKAEGKVVAGEFMVDVNSSGTEAWQIQLTQSGVPLTKDTRYEFSFDAYADAEATIKAGIGMDKEPYNVSYLGGTRTVKLTTTKTLYSYEFTMKKESVKSARVEFNGGLANTSWYIDNVAVKEAINIGASGIISSRIVPVGVPINKPSVYWYDHAGRLLYTTTGDITTGARKHRRHFTGAAIAVVRIGNRRIIKKMVNLP